MAIQHECKHEQEFMDIKKELESQRNEDKKHISWTVFWSIVLLLVGLFVGTEAQHQKERDDLAEEVQELRVNVNQNALVLAVTQEQYAQIQKELVKINVKLEEHIR